MTRILGVIAAAYPAFKIDNVMQVKIWHESLKDYDYEQIKMAVQKHILENKWPPSIAEVREGVVNVTTEALPDKDQAWDQALEAMQKYGVYRASDAMASMHPVVAKAAKSMGWREMCHSDNIGVVRGQFLKIYETMQKREHEDKILPQALNEGIKEMRALGSPKKELGDMHQLTNKLGNKLGM